MFGNFYIERKRVNEYSVFYVCVCVSSNMFAVFVSRVLLSPFRSINFLFIRQVFRVGFSLKTEHLWLLLLLLLFSCFKGLKMCSSHDAWLSNFCNRHSTAHCAHTTHNFFPFSLSRSQSEQKSKLHMHARFHVSVISTRTMRVNSQSQQQQ